MENKTHELYLFTQTPVHIGGEQEKHLIEDIDYIRENSRIWRFDQLRLIQKVGVDDYVNAAEKGRNALKEMLRLKRIKTATVATDMGEIEGKCGEVKMMVSDGLYGIPYIPGTSLKGGLRSALFKAAGGREGNSSDREVFGEFDNSVMRFVNVSDVYFYHPGKLYNSGTYNPTISKDGWEGSWKYAGGSGNNDYRFSPSAGKYNSAVQTVPAGQLGALRLSFKAGGLGQYQKAKNDKQVPSSAAAILEKPDSLARIFRIIHKYSSEYIKKEITFFKKLKGDLHEEIVVAYERLQEQNRPEAPILRIGFGSGFHAVTGDFQYEDHLVPLKEKAYNKLRKSRRLAFSFDEAADQYVFHPLGFVQLLRPEDAQPYLARLRQPPVFEPPTQTEPGHPALSTSPAPAAAPKDGSRQTADAPVAPEATTPDAVKPKGLLKNKISI
jgi:hypothetical protein